MPALYKWPSSGGNSHLGVTSRRPGYLDASQIATLTTQLRHVRMKFTYT
jgi:hypothetical protein